VSANLLLLLFFFLYTRKREKLISEGTDRLSRSVKAGKMSDVSAAQALLESGNEQLQEYRLEMEIVNTQLNDGQYQHGKTCH
jgi:hypothetical protein